MNSHYVPQLTLRRFGNRICTYNVKTGEYHEDVRIDRAFCEDDFYSEDTEKLLCCRIESQFGNLFGNKLNKCEDIIELNRNELHLIKKFLLISVIRSRGSEEFMAVERKYYERLRKYVYQMGLQRGLSEQEANRDAVSKDFNPPFIEKNFPNETNFEYWMRTLNVILESDGTPEDVLKHPYKTYPAYRWSKVINNGYLAFWDSEYNHNEFIITDIGMTSENEKGWNGTTVHNVKKTDFLADLYQQETDKTMKDVIANSMLLHGQFTENFMMFPISSRRMIVEIDPFYKFRAMYKAYYQMPALSDLTILDNEKLYFPNTVKYVLPQNGIRYQYHPDDKYIYEIKQLTSTETRYCNALFLDRVNTYCGFSSLNKAVRSIIHYKRLNEPPHIPRVDYTELYRIIEQRYGGKINV